MIELGLYEHHRTKELVEVVGVGTLVKPGHKFNLKAVTTAQCYLFSLKKRASLLLDTRKTNNKYYVIPNSDHKDIPNYWYEEEMVIYRYFNGKSKELIARPAINFFAMTISGRNTYSKINKQVE